jgi:membrane protein YqaA with SNARE-associated domain
MGANTLAAMELGSGWEGMGLMGLFIGCLLAATILPFSSEALLLAFCAGPWGSVELLVIAALGNWLGGMSSYGLGRLGNPDTIARWARVSPAKADRWKARVSRYGPWAALLCWAPIIGDPIAVALGLGRASVWPTAVLMLVGKAARYALLIALARAWV